MPDPSANELLQAGLLHHRAGRAAEAERLYRRALSLQPNHPEALHRLGGLMTQAGKGREAAQLLRRAAALLPDNAEVRNSLGTALAAAGRAAEAEAAYRRAVELRPDYAEAHSNLGKLLADGEQWPGAIAACRRALALKPQFPAAWANLGRALAGGGQLDEAVAAYRRALALAPDHPVIHANLGNALRKQGRLAEAVAAHRRAVELAPAAATGHANLAATLCEAGRLAEAIAAGRRAVELAPALPMAHFNLATACAANGDLPDAVAAFRRAIALKPDYANAHYNLALALLLRGELAEGWEEYEWRERTEASVPAAVSSKPQWRGEPLEGRTLLVWAEQGLGDAMQFVRFLPAAARRAGRGRVVLACRQELTRLLAPMVREAGCAPVPPVSSPADSLGRAGVPASVGTGGTTGCELASPDALPPFDVQRLLMGLPRICGCTLENLPRQVPYLRPEAADVERWRRRLAEGAARPGSLKVGLAWAGNPRHKNDRNRSMPPERLAPLANVAGVEFVSLQKGPAGQAKPAAASTPAGALPAAAAPAQAMPDSAAWSGPAAVQVASTPTARAGSRAAAAAPAQTAPDHAASGGSAAAPPLKLLDWTGELKDLADAAALIANLDLVIGVDTAVVHLAGALGKPVWTMLPFAPDWRWLLEREDSPWYPTMRLFRQPSRGDWDAVVARVSAALAARAGK